MTFFCTCTHVCTHVRFYTLATHGVGWGGDDDVLLHLHTCEILHFGHTSHGMGWGGDDDVLLHVRLYTLGTHHMGWGGVGMMTFFCTCTHVRSDTLGTHKMGWGGVGWG